MAKRRGVTHPTIQRERAIAGQAIAAARQQTARSIALVNWMLGFEEKAAAGLIAVGLDRDEAMQALRRECQRYYPPDTGPCQEAAYQMIRGLTDEMQNAVLALAAEVDDLRAYSPAAYRSLIAAMTPEKPKRGRPKRQSQINRPGNQTVRADEPARPS